MNPPAPPPLLSAVDTQRFGLRIGRAAVADAAAVPGLLARCREENLRMAIVRCPAEALPAVHALEAAGARLMDTLVYYHRNLRRGEPPAELRPNRIRPLRDDELPIIERIAGEIFRSYSGHYHADPRLDRARCDEGYVEWAARMCAARDAQHGVLVAEGAAGEIAGFATVRLNSPREGEGVLFGVTPAAEGRGIYWSFMLRAMEWCRERGAASMIVSTQITNLAVQKAWSRLGFELQRSCYTFHLWLPS